MSINAIFYKFSKTIDSTERPGVNKNIEFETGYYYQGTNALGASYNAVKRTGSTFACASLEVSKNDVITITGLGGGAARLYVVTDENGIVVLLAGSTLNADNLSLTMPVDGYIYLNVQIGSSAPAYQASYQKGGAVFDIVLKDAVTITAPVIELSSAARDYNYCYIPSFGRYYFVQSATILTNDIIQYSLSVDVLATWRAEILASSLYVLRSASDYNLKLVDDTWTHTTDFSETVTSVTLPQYDATGCYVITAVNAESASSANPASTMYVMNDTGLALLCSEMFDLDNYVNIDDLTATYFNPGQYITSAKWLPFAYNSINSAQGTPFELIKYGWYTAKTAGGYRVTQYGKTLTFSITIGSYTDWTDRDNNWTRYALYVPGFGVTEIDAAYSGQTLSGKISIDFNTGNANLMLTTGSGQIAAQLSGKVGADVAINQVGGSIDIPTNAGGLISKGISFAGAFAGGGGLRSGGRSVVEFFKSMGAANAAAYGGSTAAVQEHLTNAMNSGRDAAAAAADAAKQVILNPTVSTSGSDGARYTIIDNHSIYLYRRKYNHYNPAVAKLGGVCNQVKKLGDLSGYTQVANGLIEMTGTVEERNAITALLEGGFIIA